MQLRVGSVFEAHDRAPFLFFASSVEAPTGPPTRDPTVYLAPPDHQIFSATNLMIEQILKTVRLQSKS